MAVNPTLFCRSCSRIPFVSRSICTSVSSLSRAHPRSRPKKVVDLLKHQQKMFIGVPENEYPAGLVGEGVREFGVIDRATEKFVVIHEMIPELIVPDLTGFQLKAYISYNAKDTVEPEHSARDLFDAVYGLQLKDDFEKGKLDELVVDVEEREKIGQLKVHTYDREPLRMLDTSEVNVVEKSAR